MGTDRVEFGSGELRVVGGDYGTLRLEGATDEARRALDTIVAANRRSGGRNVVVYFIAEFDDTPDLFEDRDAGRSGTHERGAEFTETQRRPSNKKGSAARGPR